MNLDDLFEMIGGAGLVVVFAIIGVTVVVAIVTVAMAIGPR